jgi:hypothetical protein
VKAKDRRRRRRAKAKSERRKAKPNEGRSCWQLEASCGQRTADSGQRFLWNAWRSITVTLIRRDDRHRVTAVGPSTGPFRRSFAAVAVRPGGGVPGRRVAGPARLARASPVLRHVAGSCGGCGRSGHDQRRAPLRLTRGVLPAHGEPARRGARSSGSRRGSSTIRSISCPATSSALRVSPRSR